VLPPRRLSALVLLPSSIWPGALIAWGYSSLWVAEVTGIEAFSVLGALARAASGLGLGTGVLPVQVRTPPLLAMADACLQAPAPGREVLIGVGVSSPVVAGDWHGAGYPARPEARAVCRYRGAGPGAEQSKKSPSA
jgi:alkanesulfonate monooxygenase SsuD/methylene tetrahydromethanopterin reductase-like flavin-dependent oxidoreductase (luciferase family)